MTQRFNATTRQAFVRAVMDDVPSVDYDEKMRVLLQKFAVASLPDALKPLYKTHAHWFNTVTYYNTPSGYPSVVCVGESHDQLDQAIKADNLMLDAVRLLAESKRAQNTTREMLRDKLRALVHSVSTHEALIKAAPEFSKYVSCAGVVDKTVPVVANVLSELTSAGWPT